AAGAICFLAGAESVLLAAGLRIFGCLCPGRRSLALLEVGKLHLDPLDERQHRFLEPLVAIAQQLVFGKQRTFPRRNNLGLTEKGSSWILTSKAHVVRDSLFHPL